jgi:hypothetical protein
MIKYFSVFIDYDSITILHVLQELTIDEPCSCVCMADSFAIVGTDRFYKVNLDHPSLTGVSLFG